MSLATGLQSVRRTLKAMVPRAPLVSRLKRSSRAVLLTFDDGPHPDVTPAVLDRLDRFNAKAVFFVIGKHIARAPHLLQEIVRRGHALGNHSHAHLDRWVLTSEPAPRFREYYDDLRHCQAEIREQAGKPPLLFRPPGGRLTPVTLLAPKLLGLRSVLWSRECSDWRFRRAEEAREGAAALAASVREGDIVLLHDDNPCVVELLDVLLPALAERAIDLASGLSQV